MPEQNNYRNQEQDRRLGNIEASVKIINDEMGTIKTNVAIMKNTLKRHEALLWLILGLIVVGGVKVLLF